MYFYSDIILCSEWWLSPRQNYLHTSNSCQSQRHHKVILKSPQKTDTDVIMSCSQSRPQWPRH